MLINLTPVCLFPIIFSIKIMENVRYLRYAGHLYHVILWDGGKSGHAASSGSEPAIFNDANMLLLLLWQLHLQMLLMPSNHIHYTHTRHVWQAFHPLILPLSMLSIIWIIHQLLGCEGLETCTKYHQCTSAIHLFALCFIVTTTLPLK